jgi:hypothetical protein
MQGQTIVAPERISVGNDYTFPPISSAGIGRCGTIGQKGDSDNSLIYKVISGLQDNAQTGYGIDIKGDCRLHRRPG